MKLAAKVTKIAAAFKKDASAEFTSFLKKWE